MEPCLMLRSEVHRGVHLLTQGTNQQKVKHPTVSCPLIYSVLNERL